MAQMNIWGDWEPEYAPSVGDFLRRLDDDMPSSFRQRIALATLPASDAFLEDARRITSKDMMWKRFLKWITDIGPLETICRGSRPSNARKTSRNDERPTICTTPDWYSRYRDTDHWEDLRKRALKHFGGCVLCGSIDKPHLHHRHYNSLGNEQLGDVSILCHTHHLPMHQMLGLMIPRSLPDSVRRILTIEQKI